MTTSTPLEVELRDALVSLKLQNPGLGIAKTHALLLASHPSWAVSEKRVRKILQSQGLILHEAPVAPSGSGTLTVYPSSRIIPNFDVNKWTPKAKVQYFNQKKGKGLVATEDIAEGEIMWKEDPFILAPEWEIFDMQVASTACGFCSTPLDISSPLTISCPASAASSSHCSIRFCNRLCLARSSRHHPLLCHAANPASIPILKWARETQWLALHALVQCTSRILLAIQHGRLEEDWKIVRGFAELGLEERFKYSFKSGGHPEPDRAAWSKAHALYLQAFSEPPNAVEKRKLSRILKKPLDSKLAGELFDYEAGFLKGLGRMSLNLEAHGGLYTLHSHLNHSCSPNVSVRHLDQRTALSRITIIAKGPIKAGEELLVTYVNPEMHFKTRRRELEAWGFGICECQRCVAEAKNYKEDESVEPGIHAGLESELKAGLGVI
ncbi:hypothetical protein BDZ94DRAFT_1287217 [Collybia nuda]|uniref:Histone-lysine N-methyltransferase SET5 n=1 Tax=Collybia nuda TaxID=64659 RepID=A0A9P5YFF4_9AGAR|nr:hypothetical protein BDZ94DRAFT_1287217 [Collybia nuda]